MPSPCWPEEALELYLHMRQLDASPNTEAPLPAPSLLFLSSSSPRIPSSLHNLKSCPRERWKNSLSEIATLTL